MGLISLIFFALSKFLLLLIHSIKYFLIDSCGKLAVLSASPALSRFLGRFLIVLYFYLLLWMHSTLILGRMNNMHNIRVKTWLQENWGGPQAWPNLATNFWILNIKLFNQNRHRAMTVPVAQWIARWTSNPKVPGSNPGRDAECFLLCDCPFHLYFVGHKE